MIFSKKLSQNKAVEFSVCCEKNDELGLTFALRTKTDHAGLMFYFSFFFGFVEFNFYDIRHWDHENNRYQDRSEI